MIPITHFHLECTHILTTSDKTQDGGFFEYYLFSDHKSKGKKLFIQSFIKVYCFVITLFLYVSDHVYAPDVNVY